MVINIDTVKDNTVQWSTSETVSSNITGDSVAGAGIVSITGSNSKFNKNAIEEDVHIATPLGTIEGWVQTASENPDLSISLNIATLITALSSSAQVPPVINATVLEIIENYVGILIDPLPTIINQTTNTNTYSYIGWEGSVWDGICSFCSTVGIEIITDGTNLILRDIYTSEVEVDDKTPVTINYDIGTVGQRVEVTYQNQVVITSNKINVENLSVNPSVESNLTGWDKIDGAGGVTNTLNRTNEWAYDGTYSVEHRQTSLTPTSSRLELVAPTVNGIVGGNPLFVSLSVNRNDTATPVHMRVETFDGATLLDTYTTSNSTSNNTVRLSIDIPATHIDADTAKVTIYQDWVIV